MEDEEKLECEDTIDESTWIKWFIEVLTISFGMTILFGSWWLIVKYVTIDPKEWSMFFNAKIPLLIGQVVTVLAVVVGLDLAYKGWTIQSIMAVDKYSPWQDKAVAAAFLVGMGFIISLAVKGGF